MKPLLLQPPLTVREQVENLKSLNLIIDDENYAISFLNDVSYFRFIKAYSPGLKPKNGNYFDGITFEQLVELYLFNAKFRQQLFIQIEKIEINLRCRISNYISLKYGNLGYKDSFNFANKNYHSQFLREIQSEIKRNRKVPSVKNFQNNYENGDIPFYALIEIFSFGALSKFFKNLKNNDKKEISSIYGLNYTYFESWIESIAYVRNICAHYGRLYNVRLSKTPRLYQNDLELAVANTHIFSILCCMKHLLPNDRHWIELVDTLEFLFKKYPHVQKDSMGFPENWRNILIT